jgi:acyl-CoA synthetase (AMP-forming)/AMP-acid ligase II
MSNPLYAFPTTCEQTLQALARYPSRTAFAWSDGSITYQGTTDLIGRIQNVFMGLGLKPGARVAFLTANRADAWCERAGHATVRCFARTDDIATLNYTDGTTGKSKGALRHHLRIWRLRQRDPRRLRNPGGRALPDGGADQPVAGTKVLPTLMRGGTAHMLKGFDPEAVLKTIERERINFTLFEPTKIYVLLDHPALDNTDLSSLELLLYGASAMSPSRLVEGIERIGPAFGDGFFF